MAADTSTQIDPAREPWAALVRLLNAVSNEASEAGDEAASDRAIAFRKHVASVRDRWFAGEPSPTRTAREGAGVMRASTARDLVGQTFGRLTVTARDGCNEEWQPLWACVCTCGGRVTVLGRNLRRGRTKSCGCLRKDLARARAEKMRTGGMLRSPKLMVDYRELEEVA